MEENQSLEGVVEYLIFENEDNGRICTVYRRKDGNYGLLEPM